MSSRRNTGQIIIPNGVEVWHHELKTVKALADAGYFVEFLAVREGDYTKSPDILMNNVKWEIKSPHSDKLSAIERNLKRAVKQSDSVIIDSHRMNKIHDKSIQYFLVQKYKEQKALKRILFVNRKREVIDIGTLIR